MKRDSEQIQSLALETGRRAVLGQGLLICALIGGSMMARLVPHMPNVTPVAATALLAGAFLPGVWAVIVPMVAMLASDYLIGFYEWQVMAAVYGSFVLAVGIGRWIGAKRRAGRIIIGSLGGSMLFYLITNWAVWQFGSWYPHTLDGLLQSYYYAIPFFRNTLLGDMMYASGLFIVAEFAINLSFLKSKFLTVIKPQAPMTKPQINPKL